MRLNAVCSRPLYVKAVRFEINSSGNLRSQAKDQSINHKPGEQPCEYGSTHASLQHEQSDSDGQEKKNGLDNLNVVELLNALSTKEYVIDIRKEKVGKHKG
ncbi:hypothetical protein JCM13991_13300 [Thermodesulfovibrio hydrogeniphilus]